MVDVGSRRARESSTFRPTWRLRTLGKQERLRRFGLKPLARLPGQIRLEGGAVDVLLLEGPVSSEGNSHGARPSVRIIRGKTSRSSVKTNHECTRINTNRHRQTDSPASTTIGAQMFLQFRVLGVTRSWDEGFLGARASRPHKAWRSLGHLPPPGSTCNGAMGLLRPGRCSSRRQGGCLKHRTEAQWRSKGQDAGGTPALPGDAVAAVRCGGVSGGQLLRKPTGTLWETPICP